MTMKSSQNPSIVAALCSVLCAACFVWGCNGSWIGKSVPAEDLSEPSDNRYSQGKEKYEALQKSAKLPKYGKCWKQALFNLEIGCKQLTEDLQHRLSLGFTNCFLAKTGRETYHCNNEQSVSDCTKQMKSEAFNTYTEFFTYTQNICFFLQSQIWHEETEYTINKLSDTSNRVAEQIEDSSHLQSQLIQKQEESFKNQEMLIKGGYELKETLKDSRVDVHNMIAEFKQTTNEQKDLIFEVFDRVSSLQNLVMGEFTGFYSFIFYVLSVIICYLLTSTARVSGSRFWLFAIMTLNIVIERLVVMWGASDTINNDGTIIEESTVLYGRLWICRKFFTLCAICVWIWFAYRFQDYNKINNQLLVEIRKQNSDLTRFLKAASNTSPRPISASDPIVKTMTGGEVAQIGGRLEQLETTLDQSVRAYSIQKVKDWNTGTSGYESSDGGSSSDSAISDHTFILEENSYNDSDADSFYWTNSDRFSRDNTPDMLEELRHIRRATPLREMTPIPGVTIADDDFMNSTFRSDVTISNGGTPRKRNRPARRSAPVDDRPLVCKYNLRSRKGPVACWENPVVKRESAEDFARNVKELARVALGNRLKAMQNLQQSAGDGPRFFSSDED